MAGADGPGIRGFMSEVDFAHILEYSDMDDKHGHEAVDVYLEFYG